MDWDAYNVECEVLLSAMQMTSPDCLVRFDLLTERSETGWGCSVLPYDGRFPNGDHEVYGSANDPVSAARDAYTQLRDACEVASR